MFEWLKKQFHKEETPKEPVKQPPIIITVHGFGRRRMHEFDNLALWGKQDGYEIIQFDMYDLFDENDNEWMNWVQRAKDQVDFYHKQNRDIYLVGFSMGGVVASYLASIIPVKKLVLLAPAFNYINMEMITDTITKSAISLWKNEEKEEITIPKPFYTTFSELIKNLKKSISKVNCPVLILHGDQDEVISVKSSLNAYEKIPHDRKRLILLHEGSHRILMNEKVNWEAYQFMKLFFEGLLLPEQKVEMAKDIMDDLLKQKQALDLVNQKYAEQKMTKEIKK